MVNKKQVKEKDGKYFLPKKDVVDWEKRHRYTKDLFLKSRKIFGIIGNIPWVKFIGITGNCAAYNADKNSDIDILVITNKNRVWLSRLFLMLILKIKGKKPKKDGDADKICANLFVDETKIKWPKELQNIFTAHEITMMQPVIDKDDMYLRFLRENNWAFKYFSNMQINFPYKLKKPISYENKIVNSVENFVRRAQISYMKKKITTEIIEKNLIHFKKVDHMEKTLLEYQRLTTNKKRNEEGT